MNALTPDGFVSFREAVHSIAEILTAGREASTAIKKVQQGGYSPDFDLPELEQATRVLWTKIDGEKLTSLVAHPVTGGMLRVDPSWLGGIPCIRRYEGGGNLSLLRMTHPLYARLARIFGLELDGLQLLLKTAELGPVLCELRRTRKRQARKPLSGVTGRPAKIPDAKVAILQIVNAGKWNGSRSLKMLCELLARPPHKVTASESTISRALDELADAGERRCRRVKKARQGIPSKPAAERRPSDRL
jgi:hypothetical protein